MPSVITSTWRYLRPLWEGKDNQISIKRVLALAFSIDMIRNTSYAIHKWDIGKSYADVAMLIGMEAALIASLLGMTSYFNFRERQLNNTSSTPDSPQPPLE